ncbi:MAG: helix-turn-helix domain-containing protein [Xylophilus sp.]|nr:helix-turn-helix domain-containing protein [Xylophilus sp.]
MSQNPPFLPPDDDAPAADLHAPVAGSEVPYLRMASDSVEPAQLHSYWQDHLCKMVINSDCKAKPGHDLFFQMNHYVLARAGVTLLTDSPTDVRRHMNHVRRANQHCVALMVQHSGHTHIDCDGRDAVLGPGEVALVADWRPSLVTAEEHITQTVMMVPLDTMRGLLPQMADLSLVHLKRDHHSTQLIHSINASLLQQLRTGPDAASADYFQQSLLQTVAGACVAQGAFKPVVGGQMANYHFHKMEAFITANLGSDQLDAPAVAQAAGLSLSQAQRIYREAGQTVGDSIRTKRLTAAQQDLLNPLLRHTSAQELAYKWGFYDAAHFSRLFKAAYGLSPKAWRDSKLAAATKPILF